MTDTTDTLVQLAELLSERCETDQILQDIADQAQIANMVGICRAMAKHKQAIALMYIAHKRSFPLEPSDRDELWCMTVEGLDEMATMLDGVNDRVMQTSPKCHDRVRAMATRIANQLGKLGRVLVRMQKSFS